MQLNDFKLGSLFKSLNQNSLFNCKLGHENSLEFSSHFDYFLLQLSKLGFFPFNNSLVIILNFFDGFLSDGSYFGVHLLSENFDSLDDSSGDFGGDNSLSGTGSDFIV